MDYTDIGLASILLMGLGAVLFLVVPPALSIWWCKKKKESFVTILIGAGTFFLFALVLEKPIQNVLIFPMQMGLAEHAVSRYINARPVLWAFLVGLFPGVFEETGRFLAYKTVLKKRRNKETAISYGIGHGGFEVMLLLGSTYATYVVYAVMMKTGTFQTVIAQVAAVANDQMDALYTMADVIYRFSVLNLVLAVVERVFAVLFHIGASILVFYACRDKHRFFLYPLAILLHTLMDGFLGLSMQGVVLVSDVGQEVFIGVVGVAVFLGAYFGLYKKDEKTFGGMA